MGSLCVADSASLSALPCIPQVVRKLADAFIQPTDPHDLMIIATLLFNEFT
jgi:hypothetical protein